MFVKFFKHNQSISFFAVPILVIILWESSAYTTPLIVIANPMPFYKVVSNFAAGMPPFLVSLSIIALIIAQTFFLNYVINKHEALYKKSNLPLLLYPILMALTPAFVGLHPILFVNTFLLLVLDKTFYLYKNNSSLSLIFDSWVLLSIASLFYFPAIAFIFMLWIALIILRPFAWREWVVGMLGFALPYFFLAIYFFWTNKFSLEFFSQYTSAYTKPISLILDVSRNQLITLGLVAVMFALSLLKMQANFYKNVIKTRGFQQVFFFFFLTAVLCFLLANKSGLFTLSILAIPLSFFISYYFLSVRKNWWSEVLFLGLLVSLIFNRIG